MAGNYNITINQNSDFQRAFQVKEDSSVLDITGYTFTGRLKQNFNHTGHQDFTTSLVAPYTDGTFSISLTDVETAAMIAGTWVYDVLMEDDSGIKTTLLNGNAFIIQGVTP